MAINKTRSFVPDETLTADFLESVSVEQLLPDNFTPSHDLVIGLVEVHFAEPLEYVNVEKTVRNIPLEFTFLLHGAGVTYTKKLMVPMDMTDLIDVLEPYYAISDYHDVDMYAVQSSIEEWVEKIDEDLNRFTEYKENDYNQFDSSIVGTDGIVNVHVHVDELPLKLFEELKNGGPQEKVPDFFTPEVVKIFRYNRSTLVMGKNKKFTETFKHNQLRFRKMVAALGNNRDFQGSLIASTYYGIPYIILKDDKAFREGRFIRIMTPFNMIRVNNRGKVEEEYNLSQQSITIAKTILLQHEKDTLNPKYNTLLLHILLGFDRRKPM